MFPHIRFCKTFTCVEINSITLYCNLVLCPLYFQQVCFLVCRILRIKSFLYFWFSPTYIRNFVVWYRNIASIIHYNYAVLRYNCPTKIKNLFFLIRSKSFAVHLWMAVCLIIILTVPEAHFLSFTNLVLVVLTKAAHHRHDRYASVSIPLRHYD